MSEIKKDAESMHQSNSMSNKSFEIDNKRKLDSKTKSKSVPSSSLSSHKSAVVRNQQPMEHELKHDSDAFTYSTDLVEPTSSSSISSSFMHSPNTSLANSGNKFKVHKKTKGRVKIKMEFIENKIRRYTTFSKRKTGIMKKAYELSILTGTQVMLLVASETGHVYTFATEKLRPIITDEVGKNLIQSCLSSNQDDDQYQSSGVNSASVNSSAACGSSQYPLNDNKLSINYYNPDEDDEEYDEEEYEDCSEKIHSYSKM